MFFDFFVLTDCDLFPGNNFDVVGGRVDDSIAPITICATKECGGITFGDAETCFETVWCCTGPKHGLRVCTPGNVVNVDRVDVTNAVYGANFVVLSIGADSIQKVDRRIQKSTL